MYKSGGISIFSKNVFTRIIKLNDRVNAVVYTSILENK
jgi:hypothetical protein